jgi:hypothetical protein
METVTVIAVRDHHLRRQVVLDLAEQELLAPWVQLGEVGVFSVIRIEHLDRLVVGTEQEATRYRRERPGCHDPVE